MRRTISPTSSSARARLLRQQRHFIPTLQRPELFKLIHDSDEGDVLLVRQVDRPDFVDFLEQRLLSSHPPATALRPGLLSSCLDNDKCRRGDGSDDWRARRRPFRLRSCRPAIRPLLASHLRMQWRVASRRLHFHRYPDHRQCAERRSGADNRLHWKSSLMNDDHRAVCDAANGPLRGHHVHASANTPVMLPEVGWQEFSSAFDGSLLQSKRALVR
jgi:hypothetical protein